MPAYGSLRRYVPCLLALFALPVLLLSGCGHEHVWNAATCTEPATCSECGETEGEPLGHVFGDATCTEPATCSVCGETEGEALGHDWIPATHETPETCSRCAETRGEPLLFDIPPGYTGGYEFGEFDRFNSYAIDNGLGDTMIWFEGSYDSVFTSDLSEVQPGLKMYFAQVTDQDGNVWLVQLDWSLYEGGERFEELEGHRLCILGQYQGYSDVYQAPAILVERMFDRTSGSMVASTLFAEL